jgi:hypothetical protein
MAHMGEGIGRCFDGDRVCGLMAYTAEQGSARSAFGWRSGHQLKNMVRQGKSIALAGVFIDLGAPRG